MSGTEAGGCMASPTFHLDAVTDAALYVTYWGQHQGTPRAKITSGCNLSQEPYGWRVTETIANEAKKEGGEYRTRTHE